MEKNQFFCLGKIIKTFGYKGDLVFYIEDSFCKNITKMEFVFVEIKHERVPFFIETAENIRNNHFSVKLQYIETVDKAQGLVGCGLYAPLSEKPKLVSISFEVKDLIGFDVTDKKSGNIGKVKQVLELPQQQILQVIFNKKEILIPFNEHTVLKINKVRKTISIDAPEGLIAFYLK